MSLRNTILLQLSYFIEFEKYNAFVLRLYSQACVATNRLLVQDGVYDEFVSKFVKEVEKLVVGDGMDEKTDLGPLINEKAVAKVRMETMQQNKTCFFHYSCVLYSRCYKRNCSWFSMLRLFFFKRLNGT